MFKTWSTVTCQVLASTIFKSERNLKFFYVCNCFRYERPQAGRYREFIQFGVEILNPKDNFLEELIDISRVLVSKVTDKYELTTSVKRGLSYYTGDGFEISIESLGAQKQVCGGGRYTEGIGFALGIDRLTLI